MDTFFSANPILRILVKACDDGTHCSSASAYCCDCMQEQFVSFCVHAEDVIVLFVSEGLLDGSWWRHSLLLDKSFLSILRILLLNLVFDCVSFVCCKVLDDFSIGVCEIFMMHPSFSGRSWTLDSDFDCVQVVIYESLLQSFKKACDNGAHFPSAGFFAVYSLLRIGHVTFKALGLRSFQTLSLWATKMLGLRAVKILGPELTKCWVWVLILIYLWCYFLLFSAWVFCRGLMMTKLISLRHVFPVNFESWDLKSWSLRPLKNRYWRICCWHASLVLLSRSSHAIGD